MNGEWLGATDPDKLNGCPMTEGGGQSGVTGDQWRRKRFCEGQVGRVIGGDVVTKRPNAREKQVMRVANYRQVRQVVQRLFSSLRCQFPCQYVPPQDLSYLKINQMRRM